jgi:predicted secreted protein
VSDDKRQRRILITSHCVLNQNAVVQPLARSSGVMKSAVDWAYDEGYGIYQLPCPEFFFLGPHRPGMTVQEYDTPEFHESNRGLLGPVIQQLKTYQDAGYEIVGGLFVQDSPSCDPGVGNWVGDILEAAKDAGVEIKDLWQIPNTDSGHFDPADKQSHFGPPTDRQFLPLTVKSGGDRELVGCRAVPEFTPPREP